METTAISILVNNIERGQLDTTDKIISEQATLEPMKFTVTVTVENASIMRLWGEVTIQYNQNGRNDSFSITLPYQPHPGEQSAMYSFPNEDFRGGTASFVAKARVRNTYSHQEEEVSSETKHFGILAKQPAGNIIRSASGNTALSILCYVKSAFALFNNGNMPVYENGFGLMRTKNPEASHIWNWKKDLAQATALFNTKMSAAKEIPAKLKATNPELYKDLPEFTAEQLKMETWQAYGTGQYYYAKKKTSMIFFSKWHWVPSNENDGFANTCAELETKINSGNLPVNW